VDALSEEPDVPTVEGVEQSSIEPPKGVGDYVAADDSEAAGESQVELTQEHPTNKGESFALAHGAPISESETEESVVRAGEKPNRTSSDVLAWSFSALLSI
jgi:hypothetical protein